MTRPYQIFKCAILDVSDYIHLGVSFDDIDNFLLETFLKNRKATCRLVEGFLSYEIRTLFEKDEDVERLLNDIVKELDIMLVNSKENKALFN